MAVYKSKKYGVVFIGSRLRKNESGEWNRVPMTKKEQYNSAREYFKEKRLSEEFEERAKRLILKYLDWDWEKVENIKIVVEGGKGERFCEMNIPNWDKKFNRDKNDDECDATDAKSGN